MTIRQQWSIVGGILLVLGGAMMAAMHFLGDELFPVTIGSTAPNFRAKILGENRYRTFGNYKGQVVVLNIWATWCPPCKVEIPSLERLYREYGPRGLRIVAVSVDDYVGEDSIRAFAKSFGMTFDVLHDPTHAIERLYQTTGYPETFVIDSDGTIRKKWIGADDWDSAGNRALIAQLLGAEQPWATTESTDTHPPADLQPVRDSAGLPAAR